MNAQKKRTVDASDCPFCEIVESQDGEYDIDNKQRTRTVVLGRSSVAFPDIYPVTSGHTLVVPNRHVTSLFGLPSREQADVWSMVNLVADQFLVEGVTSMNIGTNVGAAAGQTIEHAHVHVIPRRDGDVSDPRGGVRWVIPEKARYWAMPNYPA